MSPPWQLCVGGGTRTNTWQGTLILLCQRTLLGLLHVLKDTCGAIFGWSQDNNGINCVLNEKESLYEKFKSCYYHTNTQWCKKKTSHTIKPTKDLKIDDWMFLLVLCFHCQERWRCGPKLRNPTAHLSLLTWRRESEVWWLRHMMSKESLHQDKKQMLPSPCASCPAETAPPQPASLRAPARF